MTIKMGLRCFLVLVFVVNYSFALECHNVFSVEKTTCDECIRCGGTWCKDPKEEKQCKNPLLGLGEEWCPDHKEVVSVDPRARDGVMFVPQYIEEVADINLAKVTYLKLRGYQPVKGIRPTPYFLYNTTQPSGKSNVVVQVQMMADKIQVTTTVKDGFCSQSSPKFEYVFVEVGVSKGFADEVAVLKYHVPCSCGCSEQVVPQEKELCHGYGNLTCGSCQCDDSRRGKFCEKKHCPQRGDVSSSCINSHTFEQCSGNGYCDECRQCQCYDHTPGSQYFNPDINCIDLCTAINDVECQVDCLRNTTVGPCRACDHEIIHMERWNASLLDQRDDSNRTIWVKCSVKVEYEEIEYWAMKFGEIHIMRKEESNSGALVNTAGRNVTIPVVIGIIAAIAAAVAAAVGYVMWKGQGALPTAGSNYANIEPEDSVGVNPLYKPPTSSFKNPMYAAKT